MNQEQLTQKFIAFYGPSDHPIERFYAPGRVNLIGDHTDYNGGLVFPCGVDRGTTLLIRESSTQRIQMQSVNFEPSFDQAVEKVKGVHTKSWADYPIGVMNEFLSRGVDLTGLQLLFYGDLPAGSGLSSSASIEVVTAFALNQVLNANCDMIELVKLAQSAEKNYVGVACGIMDQFAVAMAKENHAIKLDCQSLEYRQVPLNLEHHEIVVTNSNKERELAGSAYNQRTKECSLALRILQKDLKVANLAEVRIADFNRLAATLDDVTLTKRARHVITEHQRVIAGVEALHRGNLDEFGKLMYASHKSLSDDYEVSTAELDHLVDKAVSQRGVLGSRLTGAGFGGCTVSLVEKRWVESFCNAIRTAYKSQFEIEPAFYITKVGAGVRRL